MLLIEIALIRRHQPKYSSKVDQSRYVECLKKSLAYIDADIDSMGMLDNTVRKLNDVLDSCAKSVAPRAKARPRKAKLKV